MTLQALALVLCALLVPALAHAQTPSLQPVRADEGPRVDGFLDDAIWSTAPVATGFILQRPNSGEPSTAATRVRVVYTNSGHYIGFECDEPVEVLA